MFGVLLADQNGRFVAVCGVLGVVVVGVVNAIATRVDDQASQACLISLVNRKGSFWSQLEAFWEST